ncbi:MAG: amino acid adenylation domain-containing protein, partial [Cyanobacteria bacterium J06614_10]
MIQSLHSELASANAGCDREIVFLFPGQGSQYPDMGQQMFETHKVFRQAITNCAEILRDILDVPLLELLYPSLYSPNHPSERIHETSYAQPALFAVEYAVVELWKSLGVVPTAVLGHSLGEYVAACTAGVFSLEDGLKLVARRGQLMQSLPKLGSMVAVTADEMTVEQRLAGISGVAIAAYNGPDRLTISGEKGAIAAAIAQLQQADIRTKPLRTSHAYHSPLIEPILADWEQMAKTIRYSTPHLQFFSSLTGSALSSEVATSTYWVEQTRQPVRFHQGLNALIENGYRLFIEAGPAPVLTRLGQRLQSAQSSKCLWLPSLHREKEDYQTLLSSFGQLFSYASSPSTFSSGTAMQPSLSLSSSSSRKSQILQILQKYVSQSLGHPAPVDPEASLIELGADSINLIETVQTLEQIFDIQVSMHQLFEELTTLNSIAEHLDQTLADDWLLPEIFQSYPAVTEVTTDKLTTGKAATGKAAAEATEPSVDKGANDKDTKLPAFQGAKPSSKTAVPLSADTKLHSPTQPLSPSHTTPRLAHIMQQQLSVMQSVMQQQLTVLRRCAQNTTPSRQNGNRPNKLNRKPMNGYSNGYSSDSAVGYSNGNDNGQKKARKVVDKAAEKAIENFQQKLIDIDWSESIDFQPSRRSATDVPRLVKTKQIEPRTDISKTTFPLSSAQQRLWFLDRFEGASATYNLPFALRLSGELDIAALRQCLNKIVERHEALRTRFVEAAGQGMQVVQPPFILEMPVEAIASEQALTHCLQIEAQIPFDLEAGPLLRAKLLQTAPNQHILLLTLHHIIADGWSMGLIVREVMALYKDGDRSALPELPIQYADYSVWQQQQQQSEDFKARLESWVSQLSDAPPLLKLPTDFPRPAVQSFRGGVVRKKASAELSEQLKTFSRQRGTTLFNTLITAFSVLMYRYSKQSDMAVATPIAGREHPDVKNLIGFFINTLPLRLQLAEDDSFETLLKRVQGVNLKAFDNRDIPFTQLIEALPLERDPSYLPLCQVMFVLQNAPQAKFELPDLTLESLSTHAGIAQYDLTLSTFVEEDGLVCEWEYNSDLFAVETVEKMAAHFEHLLGQVTQNTGDSVARLPLLASAEQQQILELASCHTRVSEPLRPVHEWFETQVEQSPDAVALIKIASLKTERLKTERLETESWSYRQLNERANQIARHLQGAGVGANQIVAVCVERSYPQIAALLAVLKLGAAYLPMDPTYPAERLHLMLEETQATALITQAHIQTQHGLQNTNIVDVDDKNIAAYSTENLGQAVALDDRAYLIFTSGSTGRPKGTELIHRGLANFVQQSSQQYKLGSDERVLQFASISFDAAAEEIYLALCSGNALILRDDEMISSSETFCRVSAEQQLTVWDLPTAFWHRLTQDIAQGLAALPESLRLVIIGGEKVQPQTVQQWQQIAHGRGIRLLNTYGPTEATVVAAFYEVASDWQYTSGVEVPIGRPLGNVEAYVLDRYLQLVPLGVEGELYIGGSGLAAGYLNRPELTAERFIENPFEPGDRIYKTGDLVRMSATGDLIYLGRTDSQVKIRGFRVELGEIESAIGQLDAVREVAVIVREDVPGKQTLCGYVVPRSDESIDAIALKKELRKELRQRLPEYMVPTYIVQMDALPLTGNNKVDRKALPVPQSEDLATESQYQAPRNQTEAELVAIWERLLEASPIGIEDSFFELGGHSLLAMQLVSRIQQQFQVQLSLASLFQNPTIAAIAKQIADSQASENFLALADIPIADRTQPIPLSSAQQRLWFLDRFEGASATYNMPFALRLAGELDVAALKQCLNEIVERHEALRTRFADVAGQGVQIVQPPFSLEIPVEVVSEEVLTHRLQAEAQMPFDLETELLLRAKLLQVEPTQHVLLLTLHHIIADGWSMGLIVREVMALYKDGDRSALPELPIQYADYAVWQQQQQQSEDYQARLESWVSQLADAPALLKLPTDFPRPAAQTFNGEIVRRTTSAQLSQQLQRFSQRHGTTLFTTLMSAFATLMHRYSQQSDLVIATPIAGRSHPDLEHLIGFFVNTLPLRIQLSEGDSFETLLDQVHAVSLNAFNNQDIPFAQLVEALPLKRDPSYLPLCQVMFALQNAPQTKFERPDLTLENLVTHAGIAQYDLTLSASIEENGLVCEWEYNSDLFAEETVERIAAHFEHLLRQIVQNASDSVDCLSLLEKDQQQQLLSLAECPDQVNKPLRPVHEWFEARVEQSPDAIVLVGRESSETESWSYRQLNERANQIARRLQATGVESNQVVAVCIERSNNLIAALLAVLKLGAAYLPMDPSYPSERLCLMLEEAQATALITRQYIQTQHGLQAANTIDIADERIAAYPTTNLGQTVG